MAIVKNLAKIGLGAKNKAKQQMKDTTARAKQQVSDKAARAKQQVKDTSKRAVKNTLVDAKDKEGNIRKNIGNMYTGKKANPFYVAGAGVAYLGGRQFYKGTEASTIEPLKLATMNDFQTLGAPDIMMADGVSQEKAPSNMNAEGNIVFGLHNMRKG